MGLYVTSGEYGVKYKHFSEHEFWCPCRKCNKIGKGMSSALLYTLELLRNHYNKPVIVSQGGGYRCPEYNSRTKGAIANSPHTKNQAADIYIDGMNSQAFRLEVIAFLKTTPYFHYAYCNVNGNHPNMGNVVHIDVNLVDPYAKSKYTGAFPKLPARGYFKYDPKTPRTYYDKGNEVKKLQKFLNWAINANLGVDGIYGANSFNAVKVFQSKVGLTQDGLCGMATLNAMKRFEK